MSKPKTHTLVISDLHLGSPVCRAKAIIELLKSWEFERLIIAGDAFDNHNLKRIKHSHFNVLEELNRLTGHKKSVEVVWVKGNHDKFVLETVAMIVGAEVHDEYRFKMGDHEYLIVHGDIFDYFVNHKPLVTDFLATVYYFLQKMGGDQQRFTRYIKKRSKRWVRNSEVVAEKAIDYCNQKIKEDVPKTVICGHTHQYMRKEEGLVTYLNSGSWTEVPSSYITIDEDSGAQLRIQGHVSTFDRESIIEAKGLIDNEQDMGSLSSS